MAAPKFLVQNQKVEVPNEIKPIRYSYVVVGNPVDIQKAIQGIDRSITKYVKVQEPFPKVPDDQFKKYKGAKDSIKKQTEVYFNSDNGIITYLGKANNIKEAQEVVKEIIQNKPQDLKDKSPIQKILISLEEGLHRFV